MADSDKDDPDSVYHDPKEIINAWSLMDDFQVRKDDQQNNEALEKTRSQHPKKLKSTLSGSLSRRYDPCI